MATISESGSLSFLCCTVSGLDFQVILRHPDFVVACSDLCTEHSARLLIAITIGCPAPVYTSDDLTEFTPTIESRRKGLFIFKPPLVEDAIAKELAGFLSLTSSQLMLCSEPLTNNISVDGVEYTGVIYNKKATRKAVLPLLIQFLHQWHMQQQSSNNTGIIGDDGESVPPIHLGGDHCVSDRNCSVCGYCAKCNL